MHNQLLASAPSAKAHALAQALAQTVRTQHAQDPSLAHHEVHQAFALAQQQLAQEFGGASYIRLVAVAASVLIALVGLGAALYMAQP